MNEFDRWEQMLSLIHAQPGKPRPILLPPIDPARRRIPKNGDAGPAVAGVLLGTSVIAVEKQNAQSLLVSWSDSTQCRYLDQRWIRAQARRGGVCALTGRAIRRGDAIYKPQWRSPNRPANCFAMILAAELERVAMRPAGVPPLLRAGYVRQVQKNRTLDSKHLKRCAMAMP
ncbi:DUF3331 domain-containing protein [Trinickia diaoshuihuensis]|uniref:DUF3331 domain-containing protein n=1 Tax=Trinickia diaoshuihuensis TaxID=2292265 RepID=UPI000E255D58|nr:DUF3331 domain-containing protein [Trinickia diaoshuihuensis]